MTSAASYAVTGPEKSSLRDVFSPASNGDAHIGVLADCILEADKMQIQWSDMVEYTAENVKDKVASRAGVYRLSSKSNDGKYYVFYVGQAKDLSARLLQHLGDGESNDCIRAERRRPCGFRLVYIDRQEGRDQVEGETIKEYSPRCNTQKV